MSHIGVLCLPVSGHLLPMAALGRALIRRGHRVTYFGIQDSEAAARAEVLGFAAIGARDFARGALPELTAALGRREGLDAFRYTVGIVRRAAIALCTDGPAALRAAGVDALLVDGVEIAGGTVAAHLDIPYITIFNALVLREESALPPVYTGWGPARNWPEVGRNAAGHAFAHALALRTVGALWSYRRAWRLPALRGIDDTFSTLAQISQMPAALDFPRRRLPAHVHYTGPFRTASSQRIAFPYDRLDGRPLIYASLGTLHNRAPRLFRAIARGCAGLDAQLVISCGGGGAGDLPRLPGDPLLVPFAPQPEVIARASVVITHAGMNTVLDALAAGVPMVAIPIANDQPGVAARVGWAGAGVVVDRARRDASGLREAVRAVLERPAYRAAARRLQAAIREAGGVERAADLVEAALGTTRPGSASQRA